MTGKRIAKLASMLLGALAVMAVAAGTASAHVEKTKQPFTITYSSASITTEAEVICKGFHETNSVQFPGNETEGGRDHERCKSSNRKQMFTALTAGEEAHAFPGVSTYESDWFYLKGERGATIESNRVLFKVSSSDKAFNLLVYMPLEGVYPPISDPLAP